MHRSDCGADTGALHLEADRAFLIYRGVHGTVFAISTSFVA